MTDAYRDSYGRDREGPHPGGRTANMRHIALEAIVTALKSGDQNCCSNVATVLDFIDLIKENHRELFEEYIHPQNSRDPEAQRPSTINEQIRAAINIRSEVMKELSHDPVRERQWIDSILEVGAEAAILNLYKDEMYNLILLEIGNGSVKYGAATIAKFIKNTPPEYAEFEESDKVMILVGRNSKAQEIWRQNHAPDSEKAINDPQKFDHVLDYGELYRKVQTLVPEEFKRPDFRTRLKPESNDNSKGTLGENFLG